MSNLLTDFKNEDITKEEEKPVVAADGEDVVAPTEAAEVKPVSPEEVTVEIEEKEEDKDQPTKEKETKEEEQGQEEEDEEEEVVEEEGRVYFVLIKQGVYASILLVC